MMGKLKPEKLSVEYRGVSPTEPINLRRYTLTHSDITAELFLTIGKEYAWDKINKMRDEVLAEWQYINNQYIFIGHCYVDGGEFNKIIANMRYQIFAKELPLALQAIRYGDRKFFDIHFELDDSPIWIYFHSSYPELNKIEYWGTFKQYLI